MTNISEITDALRKFNVQIEITKFKNDDKPLIENDDYINNVLTTADFTYPPCDNSKCKFLNLCDYFFFFFVIILSFLDGISYEGEIVITYLKNVKKKLFYATNPLRYVNVFFLLLLFNMKNLALPEYSPFVAPGEACMDNFFENSPTKLTAIPDPGFVFALHLDNFVFRVVRQNSPVTFLFVCYSYK